MTTPSQPGEKGGEPTTAGQLGRPPRTGGGGLAMVLICGAQFPLQLQLRPRGGPHEADIHESAGGAVPAPVIAECQLRKC